MPEPTTPTRVVEDVWEKTLRGIASDFGKLVYLASLRDPNSGLYHHYGLEALYAQEECQEALRQSHMEVLYRWLEKSLEEQKDDLEFYLRGVEGELGVVLDNWQTLQPYLAYLPVQSDEAARQWFLSDLKIILEILRREARLPVRQPSA
jgi:hypothetical protein